MDDTENAHQYDTPLPRGSGRRNENPKGGERDRRNRNPRGGARGGGGGGLSREVLVSKALSKLLRHAANEAGLELDSEGFARVDQVMKWQRLKSLGVTFADIRKAVEDNEKKRFSMKPNPALSSPDPSSEEPSDWMIRANQGHSIAIESAALLKPITLEENNIPDIVVHGTYFGTYESILETGGLKRMDRTHIHFSTGLPEDKESGVISGMRSNAELLIYIDVRKSLEEKALIWWISDNGVVLTEGNEDGIVEMKYFKKVAGRKANVGTLWEDGRTVAELPSHLKNKKPPNWRPPKSNNRGGGGSGGRNPRKGNKGEASALPEEPN
ncbi:KptA family-domain-containing protein [Xylogone sp. PMI_703]|nr:KptA family-domain-containing protein [Xylogone sp. PMI_703]